jgi:hypothetical protein
MAPTYKGNFWTEATYTMDPDAPDVEWWWMKMDGRGPQPMYKLNEAEKWAEEKRQHEQFLDDLDSAWPNPKS